MAVGVKYGVHVGAVEKTHREEVTQIIRELAALGSKVSCIYKLNTLNKAYLFRS